ncbi:MAG: methylated-DNA--[protein]-cysteine S-methyltransferase [Pseudomonadota bacterium]
MRHLVFESPLGAMVAIAEKGYLIGLYCQDQGNLPDLSCSTETPTLALLQQTQRQVEQYLAGTRQSFSLPLRIQGTEFQQQVLHQLQQVEPGKTVSYKEIAVRMGRPGSVRAVANAIARNPLMLIIPCHRVIGSNGQLCGFAAGLQRKSQLLKNEGIRVNKA